MKKRLISLLLAVCMAASVLPVGAFAAAAGETFAYEYEGQTLNYKVTSDSTVEVAKNTGITGTLKIPETVYDGDQNQYTVTAIGQDAFAGNNVIEVEFPATLKTIGTSAFLNNNSLKDVEFPEGLTTIGNYAFGSVWGMTKLKIPASVTRIGGGAFQWCGNVTSIEFGAGIQLSELESGLFDHCRKLQKVVVPESVKKINIAVFRDCPALEEVILPTGVTEIDSAAFAVDSQSANDAFKLHYTGSEEQWNSIAIDWAVCQSGGDNSILQKEGVVDYNYAPADDLPDDVDFDGDASWMGSVAAAAAIGTGAAIVAYQFGTTVYLDSVLPEGADIPVTYGQLAKLMWQNAGSPEPETALAPDADEVQKAMAWAVENELIDAHRKADFLVSRVSVIRAWNKAQKLVAAK